MDDRFNTAAGWALFAGIVALGGTILSGEYYHHEHVEKGGYAVADSAPEGGGGAAAAKPTDFSAGDPVKGAEIFKKCTSCHTIASGGANGIGPNLFGVMGKKHGHIAGFAYSPGMLEKPGVWDWGAMDEWLRAPKKYISGTKMSFAGLSSPEDRASLIRYINDQGSSLPVPPPPAAEAAAAPAEGAAPTAASGNAPSADATTPAAEPAAKK